MDEGGRAARGRPAAPAALPGRVRVDGAELEVDVRGSGEPVVLIQTALTADELRPLMNQPGLRDHFMLMHYHRRGYAGSTPVRGGGSIQRDARDCRALLDALQIQRPHVVGTSYSAAVALQLAADDPDVVQTLTLVEPPPVHVPSAAQFHAACGQLRAYYRQHGPAAALDRFLTMLVGPKWRDELERDLPGSLARLDRDAVTFFETDLPALTSWQFGIERARRITAPVLYVGGSNSGPLFAEVRELVLAWLPHVEDVVLPGADHNLTITHAAPLAHTVGDFLGRHAGSPRRARQSVAQAGAAR
jgi:pimeloyl-ACP methyl ester carboxylesterase